MLFRYYVTDRMDGAVKGTNDATVANQYAECEDFFVVDTTTGMWLTDEGSVEIKDIRQGD